MNYIDLSKAIELHNIIIDEIGGLKGYSVEQVGLLASALEQIQNDDYYPTLADKITHLMFSCIKFHPFIDGNKRTAISLGMCFLELENKYKKDFVIMMEDVVIGVADNSITKDELNKILKDFIYKNKTILRPKKHK